jgi:lysophospholipid acyltransferase (LPLAT)-like uncharacterized protein
MAPTSPPPRRRAFRKRVLDSRGFHAFLGFLGRALRGLYFGASVVRVDPALRRLMRSREPVVFAAWHQDFLFTLGWISRFNAARPTTVLASGSHDGERMASMARAVGFRGRVRGSSMDRGPGALRELRRLAERGDRSLVMVCDGPRAPGFVVRPGAVDVARHSGRPLWLVRTVWSRRHVFERSWARFILPSPFASVAVVADGPLRPPADLSRAGVDAWCRDLEARLHALAERGARLLGGAPATGPSASAASGPPATARA